MPQFFVSHCRPCILAGLPVRRYVGCTGCRRALQGDWHQRPPHQAEGHWWQPHQDPRPWCPVGPPCPGPFGDAHWSHWCVGASARLDLTHSLSFPRPNRACPRAESAPMDPSAVSYLLHHFCFLTVSQRTSPPSPPTPPARRVVAVVAVCRLVLRDRVIQHLWDLVLPWLCCARGGWEIDGV